MVMPDRTIAPAGYRYGFNGKENDHDMSSDGTPQDYGERIYDPRVARFLSVDPISANYPMLTPYQFASNRPIDGVDLDGKEWAINSVDTKTSATEITRATSLYVKVRVSNISTRVTSNDKVKAYADTYKAGIEKTYSAKISYVDNGITINETIKTEVILDYSPEPPPVKNPDGTVQNPPYARLIFDDRVSTTDPKTGLPMTTPGITDGHINAFTTHFSGDYG
jgi:RHS repeat-associated protein